MKATIASLIMAALVLPLAAQPADGGTGDTKKKKPDREKIFKKKDADSDGFLTKDEFTKGAKDAEKAAKAFKNKDKDKDGKVSLAEFTAAPGKKGGAKGKGKKKDDTKKKDQ